MNEKEQIAYLDNLPNNKAFVIQSINYLTDNIIKNEIRKNPLSILFFKDKELPKEIVKNTYDILKNSLMRNSLYKNAYKEAIEMCQKILK